MYPPRFACGVVAHTNPFIGVRVRGDRAIGVGGEGYAEVRARALADVALGGRLQLDRDGEESFAGASLFSVDAEPSAVGRGDGLGLIRQVKGATVILLVELGRA